MPDTGDPVTAAEFAAALNQHGPFETRPALAVAVSGGADSTALALLGAEWVRSHGGTLTALIVDHGLRRESGEEARLVAKRLAALGIPSAILAAHDANAPSARRGQAAARTFRYHHLIEWCRRNGVLHLLLGHHRRDQAETVLMRLLHGSGFAGLAGMAPCVELADVRLLRPLLGFDPARLRTLLADRGVPWVEDPTNTAMTYERNRLRRHWACLAAAGLSETSLLQLAADASVIRHRCTARTSQLIAAVCRPSPLGFVMLDPAGLAAAAAPLAAAAISRVIATVGGRPHPPCEADCARFVAALHRGQHGGLGTLGGCSISRSAKAIVVCRERRNLPPPSFVAAADGAAPRRGEVWEGARIRLWDGRFDVHWRFTGPRRAPLELRALGRDGIRQWQRRCTLPAVPDPVLAVLPALFAETELVAAPILDDQTARLEGGIAAFDVAFRPRWSLAGQGYFQSGLTSIIIES